MVSDDDYRATELGDHWFERPSDEPDRAAPADPTVLRTTPLPVGGLDATRVAPHAVASPGAPVPEGAATGGDADPAGPVLRFGPGVPARLPPPVVPPRLRRRRRGQRLTLMLVVVAAAAALGWFGWQWLGPPLDVRALDVRTASAGPGCGGTAEVVGTVRTNGAGGTIRYRWVRSDGTDSGELEERLARGQREARLRLLWTFRGQGTQQAEATLEILSPDRRSDSAGFRYHCD